MELQSFNFDLISQLSQRDKAYQRNDPSLREFYRHLPSIEGFIKAIEIRKKTDINREILHAAVKEQYDNIECSELQKKNIASLKDENCFTVITAHQPSLMTGPLYYLYKIVSVINLSKQLNAKYSDIHVVPVFISGGEDHDFKEINHLQLYNKSIVWSAKHEKESVGRMPTEGLSEVLIQLEEICRDDGPGKAFISECKQMLNKANTYRAFATGIANLLFQKYGLLVLSMDNKPMKTLITDVILEEVIHQKNKALIESTQSKIAEKGFNTQTHVRDINFFYFTEKNQRLRIEKEGEHFNIVGSNISFSESEIKAEIKNYPERFSPNVNMRPIFQESVFPNLAYLGGGGELAYWLERTEQFDYHKIPFPVLMRRNSVAIVNKGQQKSMDKFGLDIQSLFSAKHQIVNSFLESQSGDDFELSSSIEQLKEIFSKVKSKAEKLDPTLGPKVEAEKTKSIKSIESIEGRLKKLIKQRSETALSKIDKTYEAIFPEGSLQERRVNFLQFYDAMGEEFIDMLMDHLDPFNKEFLFLKL